MNLSPGSANSLKMLLIALLASYLVVRVASPRPGETVIGTLGPTVKSVEGLGELASVKVHVTDVLSAEGEGYRGVWLIKGDSLVACDLSKCYIVSRDEQARSSVIKLPRPRSISPRVDHEKTKTWSVEKATWLPWKWGDQDAMRDSAMYHAQKLVEHAANSEEILTNAKSNTELLIKKFFESTGWTVEVEWAD